MYVQWFRPLNSFDPATGMYQLLHSTQRHQARLQIISADQILQGCHLLPKFGSDNVDPAWTTANILEFPEFYLNSYVDFFIFELLQSRIANLCR
jgi:hypothetical protein